MMSIISALICICIIPVAGCASDPASRGESPIQQAQVSSKVFEKIREASALIIAKSYREAEIILLDIAENNPAERSKAVFLLGRLYMEEASLEKAENYMTEAVNSHPLLRDYSLKMLTDIYIAAAKYEKAVGTSRQIGNSLLLQEARKSEIQALLFLKKVCRIICEDKRPERANLLYPQDRRA